MIIFTNLSNFPAPIYWMHFTCDGVETGLVKDSGEQLKADDGINNNDKHDKQHDVKQGDHCHQDGVDDNL